MQAPRPRDFGILSGKKQAERAIRLPKTSPTSMVRHSLVTLSYGHGPNHRQGDLLALGDSLLSRKTIARSTSHSSKLGARSHLLVTEVKMSAWYRKVLASAYFQKFGHRARIRQSPETRQKLEMPLIV